jgi:hypothetical protein
MPEVLVRRNTDQGQAVGAHDGAGTGSLAIDLADQTELPASLRS